MATSQTFICPCPNCGHTFGRYADNDLVLDNPLRRLLASNDPPLNTEKATVTEAIDDRQRALHNIDEQILLLERSLKMLKEKRNDVDVDLQQHKNIFKPVRRLPRVALAQIFVYCSSKSLDSNGFCKDTVRGKETPWRLSRVSGTWRAVALALPQMWSDLRLRVDSFELEDARCSEMITFFLGIQLHRSSTHPLSLSLYMDSDVSAAHVIFQVLLPSSPRWQKLKLDIPPTSFPAFSRIKGSQQSLEILSFCVRASDQPPPDMFAFAPKLHTVCGNPSVIRHYDIPWKQIKTFPSSDTHNVYYHDHFALLRLMPMVESYVFLYDFMKDSDDSDDSDSSDDSDDLNHSRTLDSLHPVSRCRHLKTFSVFQILPTLERGDDRCQIYLPLSSLALPALEILEVAAPYDPCKRSRLWISKETCYRALKSKPLLRQLTLTLPRPLTMPFIDQLLRDATLAPLLNLLILKGGAELDAARATRLAKKRPGVRLEMEDH